MLIEKSDSTNVNYPPGPRLPTFAQSLWFVRDEHGMFDTVSRRCGSIFRIKIRTLPNLVVLAEPELVKETFQGSGTELHAGEANAILEPLVGVNSILLLDEKPHLRQRKLLLPPFHGERMRLYGEAMREITAREVDSWEDGVTISLHQAMQRITLAVIMRTVFGIEEGARFDELGARLVRVLELTHARLMLPLGDRDFGPLSPRRRFESALAKVDEMLLEEIERRREVSDLTERTDVLSMLLGAVDEDGNPMTDRELRDELMTLLVAGHETTSTSLAWLFERVMRHPDVMEKLRREIESDDSGPYLDATIKETMRARPVLDLAIRKTQCHFKVRQYTVPPGTYLAASAHLIHHDPEIYPDPYKFNPERFVDKPAETYSWIPFGGGIRRCIGAAFAQFEMQVVVSEVLRRVSLTAPSMEDEKTKRKAITHIPASGAAAIVSRLD